MSSDLSGSTTGVVAAMAISTRGRRIVRAFEEYQAVSPGSARTLADLGLRESRHVGRLERAGVLTVTGDKRYYLNRDRWSELTEARRRRAVILLAVIGVVILVYWLIPKS